MLAEFWWTDSFKYRFGAKWLDTTFQAAKISFENEPSFETILPSFQFNKLSKTDLKHAADILHGVKLRDIVNVLLRIEIFKYSCRYRHPFSNEGDIRLSKPSEYSPRSFIFLNTRKNKEPKPKFYLRAWIIAGCDFFSKKSPVALISTR